MSIKAIYLTEKAALFQKVILVYNMRTMLENLFKQHEVPLWGIVSLGEAIECADGYRCIAFCLPYDSAAVLQVNLSHCLDV